MRVVAGSFRGRGLASPVGMATRPITDRVKETLFNILAHRCDTPGGLPDFFVLDVFAGPGSMGIEALSRGAQACTFVERDRRALRALRENIAQLGIQSRSTVLTDNAWTMRPPLSPAGFGLAFVDPPYRDARDVARVEGLLERLSPALAPGGLLVFRHERRGELNLVPPPGLEQVDERVYGHMRLLFLRAGRAESG